MPQVDLESLVCGVGGVCGDPKVACETTLIHSQPQPEPEPEPDPDPDLPAESFRIPISGGNLEYWLNNINPVYDRDDSTKGTTNPKSHLQHHQQQQAGPGPTVNSQRFSGNLKATAKAPIIALPNKIHHHSGYLSQPARKSHPRFFPNKTVRVSDPGSPKVSWFGKVLSERDKCRRRSPEAGCWAVFRCFGPRRKEAVATVAEEVEGGDGLRSERNRSAPVREVKAPAREPLGLGGMKRFASGRRAASWDGDVEVDVEVDVEDGHVAWSGPLDRR